MSKMYDKMRQSGALAGLNQSYLEDIYLDYLHDPNSVSEHWQRFFSDNAGPDESIANMHPVMVAAMKAADISALEVAETDANALANFYRTYGHIAAASDLHAKSFAPTWEQLLGGMSFSGQQNIDGKTVDLPAAHQHYAKLYSKSLGYEFMHIEDPTVRDWWINAIESGSGKLDKDARMTILDQITKASELERYLGIQFVGQKRFSLEGTEALIPSLNRAIEVMSEAGVRDQVIGMAHRGRLNVLVNVMGMPVEELVNEFAGGKKMDQTSGDVKYHLGYSIDRKIAGKDTHLALNYNPSHLEAVNSIVCGNVRARNDRHVIEPEVQQTKAAGILIHGDASLAGQGSVMEILNMSEVEAYQTEGTIHVVVNNQIGFTTNPDQDRSGRYCTDIAKMIQAPVIHVDADDLEACYQAATLAALYRMEFKKDVFIDIIGYRKYGHNEADEPRATQPMRYQQLSKHKGVAKIYQDELVSKGVLSADEVKLKVKSVRSSIDKGEVLASFASKQHSPRHHAWQKMQETADDPLTGLSREALDKAAERAFSIPEITVQKQVLLSLEAREKMRLGNENANWGFGEILAYASLMDDGYRIRLVGQDAERGTFSHRHLVLHDQKTGEMRCALKENFAAGAFSVYNSTLSEYAAMGFEYGYAETDLNTLVIWEAQFGDFANGAQVIFDQFISSAYQKWKRLCGLVLLLPHGYEGQGPEHSSARIERVLQLCAQNNMRVAVPTTPRQIFHLLRNQMHRQARSPLVVATPKSLLRNPLATSSLAEFTTGGYAHVLGDESITEGQVDRVVLCQGKVYYELAAMRDEQGLNIAIVRLESLYPFPHESLEKILSSYETKQVVWCQEEPFNQGAWLCIRHEIESHIKAGQTLVYHGRPPQASPAVGYASWHAVKQKQVVLDALGLAQKE